MLKTLCIVIIFSGLCAIQGGGSCPLSKAGLSDPAYRAISVGLCSTWAVAVVSFMTFLAALNLGSSVEVYHERLQSVSAC